MDAEERVGHAGGGQHGLCLFEFHIFRHPPEFIVLAWNLSLALRIGPLAKSSIDARFRPDVLLDGQRRFATRFDLLQHLLRKPPAESLLQGIRDLHAFERIESQVGDNVRVQRQVRRAFAGNRPDVIEHFARDPFVRRGQRRFAFLRACDGLPADRLDHSRLVIPAEPLGHNLQLAVDKRVAAGAALDLAARGLGNRPESHQYDSVGRQFVFRRHTAAHLVDHVGPVFLATPLGLRHNDQPLVIARVDGKRTDRTRLQTVVRLFHRAFDVLGIAIHTPHDDQILEPAGNEQLAVAQKAQIARSEVELPLGRVGQLSVERLLRVIVLAPIPLTHAWAANPNLTHLVFGELDAGFRLDDQYLFVRKDPPAPDQQTFILVASRHGNDAVFVQCFPVKTPDRGCLFHVGARDDECRLGHAVAGEKRLLAKPDRPRNAGRNQPTSRGESARRR